MEDVEEPSHRRVVVVAQTITRVLGDVERQRAVRAEHAEQVDQQPRRATLGARRQAGELGRREPERGLLAEAQRLARGTVGLAEARVLGREVLHAPQELQEPVRVGRGARAREQGLERGRPLAR